MNLIEVLFAGLLAALFWRYCAMSIIKWIKTAAGAALGGSGAWLYLVAAAGGAALLGAAVVWHRGQVQEVRDSAHSAGAAQVRQEWTAADNAALRESQREVSRLVTVNQEVQRDLDLAKAAVSDLALARARTAGLRERERADIVAAAERAAAGTCGRYAAAAERDIAGVEDDATAMGLRAATAQAAAHAFRRTLDERRAALEARRAALSKTPQPQE